MNGKLAVGILFIGTLSACRPQVETGSPSPAGRATLRNASGATIGVLLLTPSTGGIRITGGLAALPAGSHGIHLHQVGKCDAPDFATAGAHLNPTGLHHGLENPIGPHAGDLPNITASSSGTATVDLSTPRVSLDGSAAGVFDADGTAIVVHAAPDDQKTDPSGNSGARIACGVIERP